MTEAASTPSGHQPEPGAQAPLPHAAWWRVLRIIGHVAAFVVAALLAFTLILMTGLAFGPVSLGPLAPFVVSAANSNLNGLSVDANDAVLAWADEGDGIDLRLLGVTVLDPEGNLLVAAPEAGFDFSIDALLDGVIAPRSISLIGPSATIQRNADGSVSVGIGVAEATTASTGGESPDVMKTMFGLLLEAPQSRDSLTYLSRLDIRSATFTFLDAETGTVLTAPDGALSIQRDADGVAVSLEANLALPGETWRVVARADYVHGSEDVQVEATFGDIRPADLAASGILFSGLDGIDVPIRGTASLTLDTSSNLTSGALFLIAGQGRINRPDIIPEPVAFDSAEASLMFDASVDQLVLSGLTLRAGENAGNFSGTLTIGRNLDGTYATFGFDLVAEPATLHIEGMYDTPLAIDRAALRGTWTPATRNILLDMATLRAGALEMSLSGAIGFTRAGPDLQLTGSLSRLPITDMVASWPVGVGEGARSWLAENVFAGTITGGTLVVAMTPDMYAMDRLPDEAFSFDFGFEGLEANFIEGLTHLTSASGKSRVVGDFFDLTIASGSVGPLTVNAGTMKVDDLVSRGAPAIFTADVSGRIADVLALIDMEPLGYTSRYGIEPETVEGDAALRFDVVVPMLKELKVADISFDIKADVEHLALQRGPRYALSDGSFAFAITGDALSAEGTAKLNGVDAAIKWDEDFEARAGAISTRMEIATRLDGAARTALGLPEGRITGAIGVNITTEGSGMLIRALDASVDFADASLTLPELDWQKLPGEAGRLSVRLEWPEDQPMRVRALSYAGAQADLRGSASFGPDGQLQTLALDRAVLGPDNEFTATVARTPNGYAVNASGARISATGILRDLMRGNDDGTPSLDWRVAARFDRLVLRGRALDGAIIEAETLGGALAALRIDGAFDGDTLAGRLTNMGTDGRQLTISTQNAGALMHAAAGFESMIGGSLRLTMTLPPLALASVGEGDQGNLPATIGRLRINEFRIVDQPFFSRLFAAGSLTGISDLLSGEGITFTALDVPFASKDGLITIEGARANGPAVGVTFDGVADQKTDAIDFGGTLVPIYGLNSIFDEIPLIGDILAGRDGEGIFGLTYAVRGDVDEPGITVNPLSALAPGIFRRIFEIGGDGEDLPEREEGTGEAP